MSKRLLLALAGTLMVFAGAARAEVDENYSVVLLTENFPPYNMSINGKNFAQEDNIDGIAVDIVREMFKRAGVKYSLTLRFPWDRIYKLALEKPGYGVFVTARLPDSAWLERFSVDNTGQVGFQGQSQQAAKLLDALKDSKLITDASFQGSIQPDPTTGKERFYLTARVNQPKPPATAGGGAP